MPKYRKKPVVVKAFQLTLAAMNFHDDWPAWLLDAYGQDRAAKGSISEYEIDGDGVTKMVIAMPGGDHQLLPDDWIIKGVNGELYPCKPDVFEKTYEAV